MPFYKKVQLKDISDGKYGPDHKGVFAVEKIYKGEELIYKCDDLAEKWPYYPDDDKRGKYSKCELLKLIEDNPKLEKLIDRYTYVVGNDVFSAPFKYIDMNSNNIDEYVKSFIPSLFINHSCDPNIGFVNDMQAFALRDIEIGEEITCNYGCFEDENSLGVGVTCLCGSNDKCQKTLRMDFYKNPIWQKENEQYCGPYIKEKIEQLRQERKLE